MAEFWCRNTQVLVNQMCSCYGNVGFWGGSLELSKWLLLAFYTKIFLGCGDLQIVTILEKECSFSGADNVR